MRPVSIEPDAGPRSHGSFSQRTAVIVGGGSGLGRAVARALAQQGANIVIADFDGPRMDRTVEDVLRLGTSEAVLALSSDVRSDSSVRSLARDSLKSMGHVDVVVNAAGVLLQGKLEKISGDDWTWMLETNLVGAVRTSIAFLPHMTARGSGHIVNIVSYGGLIGGDAISMPYDTGQAALAVFTEGLAKQLQGTGVSASIFCPGARGPRIGQNTRSRGLGRLFSGPDKGAGRAQGAPQQESAATLEELSSTLIEGMQRGRFLILGDPSEAPTFEGRWGNHLDAGAVSR
jgi:NAD(P)-dependent dehydrogenase (short-subunit alcohol dehydrogenase family)